MTGLNHVLTGSAIALAVRDPLLAAPLAFLSHFLLDATPHFDHAAYRFGSSHFIKIMVTDGLLSAAAALFIMLNAPTLAPVVALCAFFAIAPDITWLYYYLKDRPQWWFFRFHLKIQWFERPLGAIVEAAYFIFIFTVLFALAQEGLWI